MTDPQNASRRNQRELAAAAERVLRAVDLGLETRSCPVRREGLAARYGDATAALPDETESPGDVFDGAEPVEPEDREAGDGSAE